MIQLALADSTLYEGYRLESQQRKPKSQEQRKVCIILVVEKVEDKKRDGLSQKGNQSRGMKLQV